MNNHWIDQLREHFSKSSNQPSNKSNVSRSLSKRACRSSFLRFEQLENRSLFAHGVIDLFSAANAIDEHDSIELGEHISGGHSGSTSETLDTSSNRTSPNEPRIKQANANAAVDNPSARHFGNAISQSSNQVISQSQIRTELIQSILSTTASYEKNRKNDFILNLLRGRRGMQQPGEGEANFIPIQNVNTNAILQSVSSSVTNTSSGNVQSPTPTPVTATSTPQTPSISPRLNLPQAGAIENRLPVNSIDNSTRPNNPPAIGQVAINRTTDAPSLSVGVNAPVKAEFPTSNFAPITRNELDNARFANPISNAKQNLNNSTIANNLSNASGFFASPIVGSTTNSNSQTTSTSLPTTSIITVSDLQSVNARTLHQESVRSKASNVVKATAEVAIAPTDVVQPGVYHGDSSSLFNSGSTKTNAQTNRARSSLKSVPNLVSNDTAIAANDQLTLNRNRIENGVPTPAGMVAIGWSNGSDATATRVASDVNRAASINSNLNPFGMLQIFVGAQPINNGNIHSHELRQVKSVAETAIESTDRTAIIDAVWAKRDSAMFLLVSGAVVSYYWYHPKQKWNGLHRVRKSLSFRSKK